MNGKTMGGVAVVVPMATNDRHQTQVPVVLENGGVEYLPGETLVRLVYLPGAKEREIGRMRRALETAHEADAVVLPDGRRGLVEGWRDEALRLRHEAGAPPRRGLYGVATENVSRRRATPRR